MTSAMVGVTKINCALALLLFARLAGAQSPPAAAAPTSVTATAPATPASETTPAGPLKISYVGGQLRIDALDSTLGDVLTKVAALTGVKIDIPPGASGERLPVVKLGPGPARQILASLLSGSNFDYLILASATDPGGIQNVLLMPREKKDNGSHGPDAAARMSRTPDPRVMATPSTSNETSEPNGSPAPPDNSDAQVAPAAAQTDPSAPSPPTQPEQGVLSPAALSNRSGLTTEGAMSPPSDLSSSSINQQLQQMYQQRMQMMQQNRQSVPPPAPANPESK